jgi:hypothetical protein
MNGPLETVQVNDWTIDLWPGGAIILNGWISARGKVSWIIPIDDSVEDDEILPSFLKREIKALRSRHPDIGSK